MAVHLNPSSNNIYNEMLQKKEQPQNCAEDAQTNTPQIVPEPVSGDRILELMTIMSGSVSTLINSNTGIVRTDEVSEMHDASGNLISRVTVKYNENGKTVVEEYFDKEGKLTYDDITEYDKNGNIIGGIIRDDEVSEIRDASGNLISRVTVKYNENGKTVVEEYFDKEGKLTYDDITEYDKNGNIIGGIIRDDGVSEIRDASGNLISRVTVKYNENGKTVVEESFDKEGKLTSVVNTEYDKNGNVKDKTTSANAFIADFKAEKYTLDSATKYLSEIGATIKELKTEGNKTIITFTLNGKEYTAEAVLYDKDGFDCLGYNKDGYDKNGYDKDGYDKYGFNAEGVNREGKTQRSLILKFAQKFRLGKYNIDDAKAYLESIGATYVKAAMIKKQVTTITGSYIAKYPTITFIIGGKTYSYQSLVQVKSK